MVLHVASRVELRRQEFLRRRAEMLKNELKTTNKELERKRVVTPAMARFLVALVQARANFEVEACAICFAGCATRTSCNHVVHDACMNKWVTKSGSATCPICRANLEGPPSKSRRLS